MKRSSALLLVLGVSMAAFAFEQVTIPEILKDPSKFDGKDVSVTGVVEGYQERTSKGGNKYTSFRVKADSKTLSVWMKDHPTADKSLKNGYTVLVTGIFAKEKKVGDVIFKNEIDVSPKSGKNYGWSILAKGE